MAQIYSGILGLVAFLTTLVRGWIHGGSAQSILWDGWINLLLFSVIGLVIGWIAAMIVKESVSIRLATELSERMKDEG